MDDIFYREHSTQLNKVDNDTENLLLKYQEHLTLTKSSLDFRRTTLFRSHYLWMTL
jgi:hypothetical protein